MCDLIGIGIALLFLLALSALTVIGPSAGWKTIVSLAIAAAKLVLIVWFFMRLGRHRGLIRVFAAAGLCWLSLLLVLGFGDYLTR
jgi:cytochrome c oxidase subunit 4